MDGRGPASRTRRLGRELRRLREATGKTQAEVASYVGTASTTISKIETGERNPPIPHLKLMLLLYKIDPQRAENLIQLAEQAREPGWWADYGDDVPKWFASYVTEESGAREVWEYQQGFIPGLLQTRRYAEAITMSRANATSETAESAEGFASVRAIRQKRLRADVPLLLRAVMDESVLYRAASEKTVMREQLVHLREAMSLPNITLSVLPFSVGIHPGCTGSFSVLRYAERFMNIIYVEQRGGAFYLDRSRDIDTHEATFEQISDLALSADDTMSLLIEMERRYT